SRAVLILKRPSDYPGSCENHGTRESTRAEHPPVAAERHLANVTTELASRWRPRRGVTDPCPVRASAGSGGHGVWRFGSRNPVKSASRHPHRRGERARSPTFRSPPRTPG